MTKEMNATLEVFSIQIKEYLGLGWSTIEKHDIETDNFVNLYQQVEEIWKEFSKGHNWDDRAGVQLYIDGSNWSFYSNKKLTKQLREITRTLYSHTERGQNKIAKIDRITETWNTSPFTVREIRERLFY